MKKIVLVLIIIFLVSLSVRLNAVDLNSIEKTIRTNEIDSSSGTVSVALSCSSGNCQSGNSLENLFAGSNGSGGIGGFFQNVISAIKGIFEKIAGFFKNIFGGLDNGGINNGGNDNFTPPPIDNTPPPIDNTPPVDDNKTDIKITDTDKDDSKTDDKTTDDKDKKTQDDDKTTQKTVKKVVQLNSGNFSKEVIDTKGIVVVDFYATWCGPCQRMLPVMDTLASETDGSYKIGKVDTDRAKDLSQRYGIRSLPTFIIFKDGKPVKQFSGGTSKSNFKQIINKLK